MTGVLIPLYLYPSSLAVWKPVITAKQAYPSVPFVAIANPASGPGTASDPNYVTAIKSLQDAGVKVVGYVERRPRQRGDVYWSELWAITEAGIAESGR